MIPHIMIIQSAYTDRRLSERRLEISRHTAIPSLAYQTVKPVIHIAVNPDDPFLTERLEAFRSTGCEVKPLYRPNWKLYRENWELPEGRKIVSRMDDDDVICKEYCQRTRAQAPKSGEWNLIWPNGYVFWRQTCYLLHHPGIQFVTLVTDYDKDPHQEQHWRYHKLWPTKVVSNAVGWIWVRHGDASTSTLPRYRKVKKRGIDAKRIPINLRAIIRAIADSGIPSGNYDEHKNQQILNYVLRENEKHAKTYKPDTIATNNLIAITTCNLTDTQKIREDLVRTLNSLRSHSTSDIVVVDDGSPESYQAWLIEVCNEKARLILRPENGGVSAAKNTCLDEFRKGDYEVCFLLDDDIEVLSEFEFAYTSVMKSEGVGILSWNDPVYTSTTPVTRGGLMMSDHTCGCCVIVTRSCVERCGDYLVLPGKWGSEHLEYYCRAARLGFAPQGEYADVPNSSQLLKIASTASVWTEEERTKMHANNMHILRSSNLLWKYPIEEDSQQ